VDKKKCTKPVTRFSLYPGSRTPYFWCDDCDPEQQGAVNTLTIGTQYYEALFHIWASCDRNRPNYRGVIKSLARAKGFAGNITEKNIIKFIHGPDSEVGV